MDPLMATIMGFGGNFAPRGWSFCEGQLLPISQYSALFSLLGTTYGGDGRTTFGLPDLRGRAAIGHGRGPGLQDYRLGNRGGVEYVTLNQVEMPTHSHTAQLHAESEPGSSGSPAGNMLSQAPNNIYVAPDAGNNKIMAAESIVVANAGGNQSHENRSPYLAISWIIALQGVFPSRN